ncbi:hypothetical protein ABGB17_11980 [Sphaerisporangium sp. B11E5]|uniref:hypothetical protein n=1 Tax=Sphaerisporangium sp. B11E5 TaxID=3153563 RepID=UPI00325D3496
MSDDDGDAFSVACLMVRHAFADESARNDYFVCVAVLAATDMTECRQALRKLCKSGQQRIHMSSESDSRRRKILSRVRELGVEVHVYQAALGSRPGRVARDDCLRVAVPDLVSMGVSRLVIESCDQDRRDRQVVHDMVVKAGAGERFWYTHDRPASEPLLWVPDIVAWAYGKGGVWRQRAGGVVVAVTKVGG